jgi:hypothetical protein
MDNARATAVCTQSTPPGVGEGASPDGTAGQGGHLEGSWTSPGVPARARGGPARWANLCGPARWAGAPGFGRSRTGLTPRSPGTVAARARRLRTGDLRTAVATADGQHPVRADRRTRPGRRPRIGLASRDAASRRTWTPLRRRRDRLAHVRRVRHRNDGVAIDCLGIGRACGRRTWAEWIAVRVGFAVREIGRRWRGVRLSRRPNRCCRRPGSHVSNRALTSGKDNQTPADSTGEDDHRRRPRESSPDRQQGSDICRELVPRQRLWPNPVVRPWPRCGGDGPSPAAAGAHLNPLDGRNAHVHSRHIGEISGCPRGVDG